MKKFLTVAFAALFTLALSGENCPKLTFDEVEPAECSEGMGGCVSNRDCDPGYYCGSDCQCYIENPDDTDTDTSDPDTGDTSDSDTNNSDKSDPGSNDSSSNDTPDSGSNDTSDSAPSDSDNGEKEKESEESAKESGGCSILAV